ncbi:MAG: hypothetical protein KJO36_01435 [Acidimicrobiia bacterium]|nr:hypothetical protein [Acidimicrobiia bacterium]NNC43326.1 hypothetical protein [Acidimicrobiia bacterium]
MTSPLYFSAEYHAPRLTIWRALQQPETWTALTGIDEMIDYEMDGEDLAVIRWRSKIGPRRIRGETRVEASAKPDFMTMVIDGGEVIALTTASLFDSASGTRVDVVGELEPNGFMAHLILPVVANSIENSMPRALDRLNEFL